MPPRRPQPRQPQQSGNQTWRGQSLPVDDAAADRAIPLEAGPTVDKRLFTGIRSADDRVLLRWRGGSRELYDLRFDPFQLDGGISEGETPEELATLTRRLDELEDCAGAGCR